MHYLHEHTMNTHNRPSYEELEAKCEDLQGQIIRFSNVEQELINTRDRLDREVARFRAIESYTRKTTYADSLREFARLTVESLIEAFEIECGALFAYQEDKGLLRLLPAIGLEDIKEEYSIDPKKIIGKNLGRETGRVYIEQPQSSDIWGHMGLSQVIFSFYYHVDGTLKGLILGGISRQKQAYYSEITDELAPSFMVFTQQMSAMLHNLESREELERRVRQKTAELMAANAELKSANVYLQKEIVERRRAEEALRESEKRLRVITDTATDAIIMMDNEGKVSYWNPAAEEIFGYSTDEALGRDLHVLLAPREVDKARRKRLADFWKTGKDPLAGKTSQFIALKKDGTQFPIEVSISSVKINGGWHVAGIVRDITERIKMEKELLRVQKMESLGILAGGIAHDFNNLLMGIQGNVSLIVLDLDPSHVHYKRLKNIEGIIQSGAKLTSQLLGYARKGKYEVKDVDVNQLVRETSEAFGRTRKDVTIHMELALDLYAIEADRVQIEQILWNLYVNASDAMPGGGDLFLTTRNTTHENMMGRLYNPKPGKYVTLTIRDSGHGMDKDIMERIFDPFFTTKEMGRGTGLGLASVYGIIKNHNGYIDVESWKGNGTIFRIFLPASEKRVAEITLKKTRPFEDVDKRWSGTILLVDDEEMILEIGREFLEVLGYSVLTAESGYEALEVYKRYQDNIDLVLLDMIMPNMGGGEAYDHLKRINPDVKVLLSSGYSIDGKASEILARGCNDFIQKPFNIMELSKKIRRIFQKAP